MPNYNRVILCGHVCREPEKRVTQNGTTTCDNALAVNEHIKATDGTKIDDVNYIDLTFWGKTAETFCQYVNKGDTILVEGKLKQDRWQYEGKPYSKVKVVVASFQFLGGKNKETSTAAIEHTQEARKLHSEYGNAYNQNKSVKNQTGANPSNTWEPTPDSYTDGIPF